MGKNRRKLKEIVKDMKRKKYFKLLTLCAVTCMAFFASCSNSKGEQADNKASKQVTAVIDSLVAAEPDMNIKSIEVISTKMPSIMADEVQPALNQSAEMMATYMFGKALGGYKKNKDSNQNLMDNFVTMGAPIREAMKKYESENHPEHIFGLVRLTNSKDSTITERRLYIFEENDFKNVKRVEKYTKKSISDIAMILAIAYSDEIDLSNKDFKFQDIKAIRENPILMFVVEDLK